MNEMTPILYRWRLAKCTSVKRFTFRKVSAKICNFRVPIYKGVPFPWMKWYPSLDDDCYPTVRLCNSFTFTKVSAKICNFRVPVYNGVPLPWMKWHPSFNDGSYPNIRLWIVSVPEKLVLIYATSGFPYIMGFPSHEWNDTHLLTLTADQVQ